VVWFSTFCEWCKVLSPEGGAQWGVRLRKAIEVSGIVSGLFTDDNVALARGVRDLFAKKPIIEVEGLVAQTQGQSYLAIKGAKEAMARSYGVDSASITVTLQQ
jgi:hypothetical protein